VSRAVVVLAAALLLGAACSVANPFAPSNASAKQNAQEMALKFAQCMRQHGVNLPDPGANGAFQINGRAAGASPAPKDEPQTGGPQGIDIQSSQFQAAQQACKQYEPNGAQGANGPSQQQLDAMAKFAQCMRQHGIPMQDPKASGGGISISASPGSVDPGSDQFKQAQQACQHLMPGGGQGVTTQKNG
jgi:hypothetical protein